MGKPGLSKSHIKRAAVSPTIRDLEWAAGFLEGEGNFYRHKKGRGCECVSATQVNEEPLVRLLTLFGGTLYHYPKKEDHWQPQWKWGVYGARARGLLMTLYSLMSQKRKEQFRVALAK